MRQAASRLCAETRLLAAGDRGWLRGSKIRLHLYRMSSQLSSGWFEHVTEAGQDRFGLVILTNGQWLGGA